MAQALHMGDEGHNRNRAGTSLLFRELAPHLGEPGPTRRRPPGCSPSSTPTTTSSSTCRCRRAKCSADAGQGVQRSTLLTAMARNGTDFGIRLGGLRRAAGSPGRPRRSDGLYFPGFGARTPTRTSATAAITETAGIGGFAMAAAPAIVQFVGGSPKDAARRHQEMYEITLPSSKHFTIPALELPRHADRNRHARGGGEEPPPRINTGIAHRNAGVGQIGAGLVRPPMEIFEAALVAFAERYGY